MAHKLKRELDSLYESIIIEQEVAGQYALQRSEDKLADVEQELSEVGMVNAYERHLLDFLQDAKEEFQDPEEDRDEPLCSCSNPYCSLKKGQIPPGAKLDDDLGQGIMSYLREHDGDAAVLKDAREDWVEKCSRIKSVLREALSILRRDKRPEDMPDSDTEQEPKAASA